MDLHGRTLTEQGSRAASKEPRMKICRKRAQRTQKGTGQVDKWNCGWTGWMGMGKRGREGREESKIKSKIRSKSRSKKIGVDMRTILSRKRGSDG
jgi:hypothetical protein